MKVVDLLAYRNKKMMESLEKRIGELSITPSSGTVAQIKTCFKEWLKIHSA